MPYRGAKPTELASGDGDLPGRRHNILNDQDLASRDLGAFGQPGRAVSLSLLPHEGARQAGSLPERGDDRDSSHFQASQNLCPDRNEGHHRLGELVQQSRIGLELILVEVLTGRPPRTPLDHLTDNHQPVIRVAPAEVYPPARWMRDWRACLVRFPPEALRSRPSTARHCSRLSTKSGPRSDSAGSEWPTRCGNSQLT